MLEGELTWWDRIRKGVVTNRVSRMSTHYHAITEHIKPQGRKEQSEADYFKRRFEQYHTKAGWLIKIRLVLYALLYATIIVNFIKLIPLLQWLVPFIQLGSAIFGTTVLVVLVLLITVRVNLYIELMNEALTHLIVLYHRNPRRDTDRMLVAVSKTL